MQTLNIQDEVEEYTSGGDMKDFLGENVGIIRFADLEKYKNFNKFIPGEKGYKIILVEHKPNTGHWVAILKYIIQTPQGKKNKIVEFFDSYGASPTHAFSKVDKKMNHSLGQEKTDMTDLLNKAYDEGYKIIYNKKRFQSLEANIATCGRFVILRCLMLENYNLDLPKFIQVMERFKHVTKLSFDEIAATLVFTD